GLFQQGKSILDVLFTLRLIPSEAGKVLVFGLGQSKSGLDMLVSEGNARDRADRPAIAQLRRSIEEKIDGLAHLEVVERRSAVVHEMPLGAAFGDALVGVV